MKQYMVRMVEDGKRKFYYILDNDVFQLVPLPTKYLKHKIEANRSPNTVRRVALSLCYYLQYLSEIGIELTEVSDLGFEDQTLRTTLVLAERRPPYCRQSNRKDRKWNLQRIPSGCVRVLFISGGRRVCPASAGALL